MGYDVGNTADTYPPRYFAIPKGFEGGQAQRFTAKDAKNAKEEQIFTPLVSFAVQKIKQADLWVNIWVGKMSSDLIPDHYPACGVSIHRLAEGDFHPD